MEFGDNTVVFDGPKVMGVINVTPDSFSDGGKYFAVEQALMQAQAFIQAGATFIDVGGESTRPGASPVDVKEELRRVIPVIEAISAKHDCIISIDTSKPEVMRAAVRAGATLINDVRALSLPGALEAASELASLSNIPSCIMHMQGTPVNMQNAPRYECVVDDIVTFFNAKITQLTKAGFTHQQIMLDPGFGFGKTVDHNYQILKNLTRFTQFGLPVLAGMSRKSMIGNVIHKPVDQRIYGDIACHTIAAMNGAKVLRVHDVAQMMDAVKIVDKIHSID